MKILAPLTSALAALFFIGTLPAQVPQLINYQGRVVVGATNFDGSGQFKFALVDAAGTTTYWSNDGSSVAGSQPAAAVSLPVAKGLYSVLLGDTTIANMTALPPGLFTNPDVRLRVWFNDGATGSQLLSPDQRIAAVGYALMAEDMKDGAITSAKLAPGAVTAASIEDGAIASPQLAPGALSSAQTIAGPSQTAQANTHYATTAASLTTITLPADASAGDVVQVSGVGTGGWTVQAASGQQLITRWTPRESNRVWVSVASSADGSKLVAAVQNGQIYTSTDAGANWTPRESNRNWASVASSSDGSKLVAVVNGGQIYTSTDSGVNFLPRESNRSWISVASSSDGSKLVAAELFGQIYTSTNSGATWTARESNRTWISVTSSADGSKLVALVNGGRIYTSTDSGANWTPRESNRSWLSVASSSDGSKLAALVNGGQIYTTTLVTSGVQGTNAALQYLGNGQWMALEESQVAPGAVGNAQLSASAVQSANIAPSAVGNTQLAPNAVAEANIADGAVTNAKLASSSLTLNPGAGLTGGGIVSLGGAVTLGSTATSGNTANTIVSRDANGGFAAGAITATSSTFPTINAQSASGTGTWVRLHNTSTGGLNWNLISTGSGNGEGPGKLLFNEQGGVGTIMTLTTGGLGVGTDAPSHLLHVNGVARSAQPLWATSSDARVKENIHELSGSLEKLGALRPVTFEYAPAYRAGHAGLEGTFTGFLAQDVQEVFPEMVSAVREDAGGEVLEDFRLLNTSGLLPHVVAGVQALQAENEALRKRAADLEDRIKRLENSVPSTAAAARGRRSATPPGLDKKS